MERNAHPNRHPVRSRLRRLGGGVLGLLFLAAAAGCGGHEAATGAVIFVDSDDATWSLPDDYGDGVNTIGPQLPILIMVQKSADDPTPIPGADITITVGGVSITGALLRDPATKVQLDNGAGVYQTQTDDHGVVVVEPRGTVTGCTAVPATDTDVTGNLSIGIFISGDSAAWNGNFSYTCKA